MTQTRMAITITAKCDACAAVGRLPPKFERQYLVTDSLDARRLMAAFVKSAELSGWTVPPEGEAAKCAGCNTKKEEPHERGE